MSQKKKFVIFVTEGETSWFTALFSPLFHCVFGQAEVKNTTDEVILEIVKTRSKQNKVTVFPAKLQNR